MHTAGMFLLWFSRASFAMRVCLMPVFFLAFTVSAKAGNLPVIYIDTPDSSAITSRDVWTKDCLVRIVLPDGTVDFCSQNVDIKGRGHSTFAKPKKPYAIKLDGRHSILGMAPGKRWALLANFMDHSQLRNMLALEVARRTSLAWTPDCRPVDVVVNGRPQGCYLLCEQVRVARNRVEIDENRGFLFELDSYDDGDPRFVTACRRLPVNIKSPDPLTDEMREKARLMFDEIEQKLYSSHPDMREIYDKYIDAESFADWWLVHEIAQNAEPNGPRSCYMYCDEGGRLTAGPVWDFDLAFITVGVDAGGDLRPARLNRKDVRQLTTDSLYNRNALWYDRLLSDPDFVAIVKRRWQELKLQIPDVIARFDSWRTMIEPSAIADEHMWAAHDPARFDTFITFRSSSENLRRTFLERVSRMDSLIESL